MLNQIVDQISTKWYSDAEVSYQASRLAKTMKGDRHEGVIKAAWKQGWVERHSRELLK